MSSSRQPKDKSSQHKVKQEKVQSKVQLAPTEVLEFNIPADGSGPDSDRKGLKATLSITNPTDEVVMFKVKTTAPKKYCVKPNQGEIPPKGTKEIQVNLQIGAKSADGSKFPSAGDACKDKFLVQSVTESQVQDNELWDSRKQKTTTLWKQTPIMMENKMRAKWNFTAAGDTPTSAAAPVAEQQSEPAPEDNDSAPVEPPVKAPEAAKTKPATPPPAASPFGRELTGDEDDFASPAVVPKPAATVTAAPKPSSRVTPAPRKPLAVPKPTPAPERRTQAPSSQKVEAAGGATATTDGGPLAKAKGVLLVAAFFLGILFGKYVL